MTRESDALAIQRDKAISSVANAGILNVICSLDSKQFLVYNVETVL